MSGTWSTDWATNDVVTAAEFRKSVGCVADTTLGGTAASIDITGIPTTYAHLFIEIHARCDAAIANGNLLLQMNGDGAAHYNSMLSTIRHSATVATSEFLGTTSIVIGSIPGASAPASYFASCEVVLPRYADTSNNHELQASGGLRTGNATGNFFVTQSCGWWDSSGAAINRITLFPPSGNFIAGTRASVYVMGS